MKDGTCFTLPEIISQRTIDGRRDRSTYSFVTARSCSSATLVVSNAARISAWRKDRRTFLLELSTSTTRYSTSSPQSKASLSFPLARCHMANNCCGSVSQPQVITHVFATGRKVPQCPIGGPVVRLFQLLPIQEGCPKI
jgi:hypothetical protein